MKYKDLTPDDIQIIRAIYENKSISWDERMKFICNRINKSERTARKWLVRLGLKERVVNGPDPEQFETAKARILDTEKQVFMFTWAQNDTPAHKKFFNNVLTYADFRNGNVHVIAGRYRNPTAINTENKYESWAEEFTPYLDANRHVINGNLSIMSDVKIQPTAINPMVSMAGMSGQNSCIFGSPKVQFNVIPALNGYEPKKMWTTGACTVTNYTDSKAGKLGEFHHTLGFVIVEVDGEISHVRQVTAGKDGSFNDLFFNVKDSKITRNKSIEAIVLGDIHLGDLDNLAFTQALNLMGHLKPKYTVIHDLFNGHSINHHEANNPIAQYKKEQEGRNSLTKEIKEMNKWLEQMKRYNLVVVRSNHDDFVDRWILNNDWKASPKNAMEYITYTKVLLEDQAPKGIIPYIINDNFGDDIITLGRDESFRIKDWELGVHGDMGQNGTKGSLEQFRRLNTKMISAHTHTPARVDGVLVTGTMSKLRVGYNQGASSWMNSNVIIHNDGKAQHINIIKNKHGEYRYTSLPTFIEEPIITKHMRFTGITF